MASEPKRETCWGPADDLMAEYHDLEWGVPCHDDQELFERLMLEGFQAGLSWSTILNKRENFRAAFDNWDPAIVANYDDNQVARLMDDAGIVRNRLKVVGAVRNARAFIEVQAEHGTFDAYIWGFAPRVLPDAPIPTSWKEIPARTEESDIMSKALQKRGLTFVGSTICYAFMQSVGMVNDHLAGCPARATVASAIGKGRQASF
ncbi:MAG: DNA-3-methyladenine glycosylase I [bacterium]